MIAGVLDLLKKKPRQAPSPLRKDQAEEKVMKVEFHPKNKRVQSVTTYTRLCTIDGNPITPQDTMAGYNRAKIDQLKAGLGIYAGIQTEQSGAQESARPQPHTL